MSVRSVQDIATIQYGGLYIPIASWFYIYQQTQSRLALYSLPLVVLGATIAHGIFQSIYGPEGPKKHPKKRLTAAGYSLALMYTKSPGGNPDSVDELIDRIAGAFTLRRALRFILFSAISIVYVLLTGYSLLPLYQLSMEVGNLVAGALFLSQSVFIIQGIVMNRFASVLPPEEAEWVWVPEYRRVTEVYTEDEDDESDYRDFPYILTGIKQELDSFISEAQLGEAQPREEYEES